MRDVIRMASHAYHYLAVFDEHSSRPLYLGRTRRIASPDQRVVLYAKDRGCTHPGCDVPGYWCEVHHLDEWAAGGLTDVDKLTFACTPHHKLIEEGWRTRKLPNGRTEWIPPPQLGPRRSAPTTTTTPNACSKRRPLTRAYFLNRPANPRSGRSALVISPGAPPRRT